MPTSKASQAEIAKRRAGLIRLRRQGVPYDDQRITALGFTSVQHASKDLIRALEDARADRCSLLVVARFWPGYLLIRSSSQTGRRRSYRPLYGSTGALTVRHNCGGCGTSLLYNDPQSLLSPTLRIGWFAGPAPGVSAV